MRALVREMTPAQARRRPSAVAPRVLAQRRSTLSGPAAVAAPPIRVVGRPLEPSVRHDMERSFGADFAAVRVHDDAFAHDSARTLNARAFAAGNDVVFGVGQYRPETGAGRALLAHELAHTVQQGGVQMKAEGPIAAGTDHALELEADRAAAAVAAGRSAPSLTRIGRPALLRAGLETPPPGGVATPAPTGPSGGNLPPNMTEVARDDPEAGLIVEVVNVPFPRKGTGDWFEASIKEHMSSNRLNFIPVIGRNDSVGAHKEDDTGIYRQMWIDKYGFKSLEAVSEAFLNSSDAPVTQVVSKPGVRDRLKLLPKGLKKAGANVDHIVEKQLGGVSQPSNLQLYPADKNQAAGYQLFKTLEGYVKSIREPDMRGDIRKMRLNIRGYQLVELTGFDPSDPDVEIERALRDKIVAGTNAPVADGDPIGLYAGSGVEVTHVREGSPTPINDTAQRLVPGMQLKTYERSKRGRDRVSAVLGSRAANVIPVQDSKLELRADKREMTATASESDKAIGGSAQSVSEVRTLKIANEKSPIKFYYPYLSPGVLNETTLGLDGKLVGKGYIDPTIPILDKLAIVYEPPELKLVAPIPASKLRAPFSGFRFTDGSIAMQLAPNFRPQGDVGFEIGPKGKPFAVGRLKVQLEGSSLVGIGELKPGGTIPGLRDPKGEVTYHSEKGWYGKLGATSSTIPGATVDAEIGFRGKDKTEVYGHGGLKTTIKGSPVEFHIDFEPDGDVAYSVRGTIKDPIPKVEEVRLRGRYRKEVLFLEGETGFAFKGVTTRITIQYRRRDGEDGKFSGEAKVDAAKLTPRASGELSLRLRESGALSGSGSITFRVTDNIRPTLAAEYENNRLKISGKAQVGDIPLSKMWPEPNGRRVPIIKGLGIKFPLPTPVPGVTIFGEVKGSLGIGYGVGPVAIRGVAFEGSLYPLEDDLQVQAKLSGRLSVPAYGELYGTFGANIGVEVIGGVAGGKGGIELSPALRIDGDAGVAFSADYAQGGFAFEGVAYAKGQMSVSMGVDLKAEVYALSGLVSKVWTFPVASVRKTIGPELKVTLGRIAYGKDGKVVWPELSQIEVSPKEIDPVGIVKEIFWDAKGEER